MSKLALMPRSLATMAATDIMKAPPRAVLTLMGRSFERMPQVSRYTVVSLMALALDSCVYLALSHSGTVKASLAAIIGYCLGLLLHYTLSSRFVFDASKTEKSNPRLFVEFVASGLVGVFLTWVVISILVDGLSLWPIVGKAVAVIVSFTIVYVLRRSFVFAAEGAI